MLNLVEGVKRWEAETGETDQQPVVVMSSDGVNRVGLYTLLSYARDQFKLENKVNVIQELYQYSERRTRPYTVL